MSPGGDRAGGDAACALCGARAAHDLFMKRGFRHVRCDGCGLVALRPMPTAAELAAHHERSYRSGRYAGFAAAEGVRAAVARDRLRRLRPLAPSGPWLDVGASAGAFVAAARAAGIDVQGLELSAEAVAQARARGLPVEQGDVDSWTPPRRFAVVTLLDVIEHVPVPVAFLRRVHALLDPDGLLALTLPDCASPTARLLGRHWFYWVPPDHVHGFTAVTIARLLDAAGFAPTAVRRVTKPLPLAYAAGQATEMVPPLAPMARRLVRALPARWAARALPLPLGEMLVTARPLAPRAETAHGTRA